MPPGPLSGLAWIPDSVRRYERHDWQKVLKAELKAALSQLEMPAGVAFTGFYDSTDPRIADTENSLFTNLLESMPRGVSLLRFEQGRAGLPAPPVDIDRIGGDLHYYRYTVGGQWTTWEPAETLARWDRVPRRLPDDGSARPVRFALREANADRLVWLSTVDLERRTQLTSPCSPRHQAWPAQRDLVQRKASRRVDSSLPQRPVLSRVVVDARAQIPRCHRGRTPSSPARTCTMP